MIRCKRHCWPMCDDQESEPNHPLSEDVSPRCSRPWRWSLSRSLWRVSRCWVCFRERRQNTLSLRRLCPPATARSRSRSGATKKNGKNRTLPFWEKWDATLLGGKGDASCATNTPSAKEVWSCKGDEGRPLGAGDQESAPNRRELLPSRAVVVNVAGKGGTRSRQVRSGETSASEPLMTCRNPYDGVETRGKVASPGMSSGGALKAGPSGTRLGGGVKPDQALLRNVEPVAPM